MPAHDFRTGRAGSAPVTVAPSAKRSSWTRRAQVAGLAATVAALIAGAGEWAARRESAALLEGIQRSIDVYALGLRSTASRFQYLPYTAARQPALQALLARPGDAALQAEANRYLEAVNRRADADALYLMDRDGRTLAASNWNTPDSFVDQNYAQRPYFKDANGGRSGLFYGIGLTTGRPGLFMAAPVLQQDRVIGVLAVKVSLQALEAAWAPAGGAVLLTDRHGIVFLGSEADWLFRSVRPVSEDGLQWVLQHRQYGPHIEFPALPWQVRHTQGEVGYRVDGTGAARGADWLAVDEALPEFGWTMTVMTERAGVDAARRIAWAGSAMGAAMLALALVAWRQRERRLAVQDSARRELEQRVQARTHELHEAHAFRKSMEDSLLVGMRARDLDGRIVYVNPALGQITGYTAEQMIGKAPPYPYWHPDNLAQHWDDHAMAMAGQAALTGFESRIRHRDGHEVHTMVYTARWLDANGRHRGWMSSVVDITAQKKAEEQQRVREAQLQHAGRLASLGEMASTVAHELNQPLMALANFAGAARAFAARGDAAQLADALAQITDQARRAGDIVRRVRGFVRQGTERADKLTPAAVMTSVLALLAPEIRQRQARVETRVDCGPALLSADRTLIEQALLNLVLNALQAVQDLPRAQRVVRLELGADAQDLWFRVLDRGPGLSADTLEKLFTPFFTTKPDGLGLGLKVVRTIVESHRGQVSGQARDGGGAIFILRLPRTP